MMNLVEITLLILTYKGVLPARKVRHGEIYSNDRV